MKPLVILLFLLIFIAPLNGQSKNTLIFANALERDKKMQKYGTVLTIVGGVTLFAGNIMYRKVYDDYGNNAPPENKLNTYRNVMFGGIGLMTVGIPLWAVGTLKEKHLRLNAQFINKKGTASICGIGIKMSF